MHRINRSLEPGEIVLAPTVNGIVVLWPPHRDVADGQKETHYHADPRFGSIVTASRLTGRAKWEPRVVLDAFNVREADGIFFCAGSTSVGLIGEAIRAEKYKGITARGLCPHRGFNMYQAPTLRGYVVCPMHGLRYFAASGKSAPYKFAKAKTEDDLWRDS